MPSKPSTPTTTQQQQQQQQHSFPRSSVVVLVQASLAPVALTEDGARAPLSEEQKQRDAEYAKWCDAFAAAAAPHATAVHRVELPVLAPSARGGGGGGGGGGGESSLQSAPPAQNADAVNAALHEKFPAALIATHLSQFPLLEAAVAATKGTVFTVMADGRASRDPQLRLAADDKYATHMVTHNADALHKVLGPVCAVAPLPERRGKLKCPWCAMSNLDALELWHHAPLFHINVKKNLADSGVCPICDTRVGGNNLFVHIHDAHAPPGTPVDTSRSDIRLYSFALVVVRRKSDNRFLMVEEYSAAGFWLPGGGVDSGELPWKAAARECEEEAGCKIHITGLLRVEISPHARRGYTRMRYIFAGELQESEGVDGDRTVKTHPDFESRGAAWVAVDELDSLRLRGPEPAVWFPYVANGGAVYPISILGLEGSVPGEFVE